MANNEIRRNKVLIQTKAKEYYKNNKDKLSKQARERYNGLSAEEKDKKREYGKNRYHPMSEKERNKKREREKKQASQYIRRRKS